MAAPLVTMTVVRQRDVQADLVVVWALYNVVATMVWAKRRGRVDRVLLAHVALVVLGLEVVTLVLVPH